jgi:hypothetical protein
MSGFVSKDTVLHILLELEENVAEVEKAIKISIDKMRIEQEEKLNTVLDRIDKDLDETALFLEQSKKSGSFIALSQELSVKCM